ncbi:MAG: hypothetical protein AAF628_37195 [Planctomycetota bacterium]
MRNITLSLVAALVGGLCGVSSAAGPGGGSGGAPLGAIRTIANGWRPSVAYDAAADQYCVVWRVLAAGAGLPDVIYGQRLDRVGNPVGSVFSIYSGAGVGEPRVADVGAREAFVVLWSGRGGLQAATVRAATGAVSAPAVAPTAGPVLSPDLANAVAGSDTAVAVWSAGDEVRGIPVMLDSAVQPPRFGAEQTIGAGTVTSRPSISQSGGTRGRYLVVWSSDSFFTGQPEDVVGAVIDAGANVLLPQFGIADTASDEANPHVDGNGNRWVVAYGEQSGPFFPSYGIRCRGVELDAFSGGVTITPQVALRDAQRVDWRVESVAWLGRSVLLGYSSSLSSAYVQSVDPFTCRSCEGEFVLAGGSSPGTSVAIASQRGTHPAAGDQAMVAWLSATSGSTGVSVAYQRFRADDGVTTDLGGGCGKGGTAFATCARMGNSSFAPQLRLAQPRRAAWLLLSGTRADFRCGPCTVIPNAGRAFLAPAAGGGTDARGGARVRFQIPPWVALSGATFYQQWLVADDMAAPCVGLSLSNALRVQIE